MKEEVSARILLLLNKLNLNKNQLSQKLGFANVVIGNITNLRNLPSFDFLYRLKNYDNRINMNWLVSGEGEMFNDDIQTDSSENVELYKSLIVALQSENALLKEKIERLMLTNDSKNKKVS